MAKAYQEIKPEQASDAPKKEQVATMFNHIAGRYDFMNRFLSMGIDKGWRRRAIKELEGLQIDHLLDVATGTGDFALQALTLKPNHITGIDISEGMLEVGRKKIRSRNLHKKITLQLGDSENILFADNSFDAVTVAFGVRNFQELDLGLAEIFRVLKPDGKLVVLEFSRPKKFPVKHLYGFYFNYILPLWGKLLGGSSAAYSYLPASVLAFPEGEVFLQYMQEVGFRQLLCKPLSFRICSIYTGTK
ncbi:MAG: bifunctional demethylmenaquinone methyltransferase/2-methoxy-6-polyprenyl-1,4-benzoquinol methylase UbiE [Flavobacteriaceae bacterium]|nr:bifunctional demethylmenaquinone methyltransferase/2-methoxy-6-polyprenyl-1,4-benzoquinol methylase UbiE [Flavobacteriaceae bacterium]